MHYMGVFSCGEKRPTVEFFSLRWFDHRQFRHYREGISLGDRQSFFERHAPKETTMKAQLLSNALTTGSIARDYIRLVQETQHPLLPSTRLQAQVAHAILESFQEPDERLAIEAIPPIKRLVAVLTEGLQGIPGLRREDGRVAGEMLFRGCHVRLIGIPERFFVVRDIFWDYQEVRIREPRTRIDYVVPWDCLVFRDEQER